MNLKSKKKIGESGEGDGRDSGDREHDVHEYCYHWPHVQILCLAVNIYDCRYQNFLRLCKEISVISNNMEPNTFEKSDVTTYLKKII